MCCAGGESEGHKAGRVLADLIQPCEIAMRNGHVLEIL